MATAVTHDERELVSEINAVVEKYGLVEKQIQRFKDIDVSQKLEAFLNHFHGRDEASVLISNLVLEAANSYRRVEDEAKAHVQRAEDFAQENIDAVEGVINKRYVHEEALDNFCDMGKQLNQSFDHLIEAHQKVLDGLKEAERKAKTQIEEWGKSKRAADTVVKASIPVVGSGYGAKLVAQKAAASVENKHGKIILQIVGGAAGLLCGLVSSLLVLPLMTSAILSARYNSWEQEFREIQSSLHDVDMIISEHKNTLGEICHHVKGLCKKYEALENRRAEKRPIRLILDHILDISKKLKSACSVYLERINTTEVRLPSSDTNPTLPIQCGEGSAEAEDHN